MIVDGKDRELTKLSLTALPATNVPFSQRIQCRDGYKLKAVSADGGVVIWAKAAPGDSFQNIQSSPIDLTPFIGTTHTFFLECRVAAGSPRTVIFEIKVAP